MLFFCAIHRVVLCTKINNTNPHLLHEYIDRKNCFDIALELFDLALYRYKHLLPPTMCPSIPLVHTHCDASLSSHQNAHSLWRPSLSLAGSCLPMSPMSILRCTRGSRSMTRPSDNCSIAHATGCVSPRSPHCSCPRLHTQQRHTASA